MKMNLFLFCILLFSIVFVLCAQKRYTNSDGPENSENNKTFPLIENTRRKRQTCTERRVVHTNFRKYFKTLMSNYSKYVPPYYPNEGYERDESFALRIRMNAKVLVEINDVDGRMTTVLGFLVEWKDSNLVWVGKNTFVYSIILDSDMIWKPHIEVGNPHVGRQSMADNILDKNKKILLDFRGQVTWSFVWTVDTRCKIDITYYPFDRQHCRIELVLSSDLKNYISFHHDPLRNGLDNGIWKHVSTSIYNFTHYKVMQTHFIIEYTFDRKSVKPVLVFMAPVLILISILPLVFMIPNHGSDRLSISLTVLLAVSVYMTLVVDKIPDSSDPLPFITTVFFALYAYNAFIMLLVLVNGKIYRLGKKRPVPICIQDFVNFSRRCFCIAEENVFLSAFETGNGQEKETDTNNKEAVPLRLQGPQKEIPEHLQCPQEAKPVRFQCLREAVPESLQGLQEAVPVSLQGLQEATPVSRQGLQEAIPISIQGLPEAVPVRLQGIQEAVPGRLQGLANLTRRCICMNFPSDGNNDLNDAQINIQPEENRKCSYMDMNEKLQENENIVRRISWTNVSSIIDKWVIILLYALEVGYSAVAFFILSTGNKDEHKSFEVPTGFHFDEGFLKFKEEAKNYECVKWE